MSHTHIVLKINLDDTISMSDRISGWDKWAFRGRQDAGRVHKEATALD